MRRFGFIALSLLLGVALIGIGVLFARVETLDREVTSVRAAASASAKRATKPAYPLTVDTRDPRITFGTEADMARYVVRVHDKLEALTMAMEKDIHAAQDSGRGSPLPSTHAMIDGKTYIAHESTATAPFLGYHPK